MVGCVVLTNAIAGHITRQNFGYTLKSRGRYQFISGHVRMVFHVRIPRVKTRVDVERVNCTLLSNKPRLHIKCPNTRDIANHLFKMKYDIVSLLAVRLDQINEILYQLQSRRTRGRRSFFSLVGSGLAEMFSLSTKEDFVKLEQLMQNVLEGTQKAVEAFAHGENLFTRIANLTEGRYENIDMILNSTSKSIIKQHEQISAVRDGVHGISGLIALVIKEINVKNCSLSKC